MESDEFNKYHTLGPATFDIICIESFFFQGVKIRQVGDYYFPPNNLYFRKVTYSD